MIGLVEGFASATGLNKAVHSVTGGNRVARPGDATDVALTVGTAAVAAAYVAPHVAGSSVAGLAGNCNSAVGVAHTAATQGLRAGAQQVAKNAVKAGAQEAVKHIAMIKCTSDHHEQETLCTSRTPATRS